MKKSTILLLIHLFLCLAIHSEAQHTFSSQVVGENKIEIFNPYPHCVSIYQNGEYKSTMIPNFSQEIFFEISKSYVNSQTFTFVYDIRALEGDITFCKLDAMVLQHTADKFQTMGVLAVDFFKNKYSYEIFMLSMYAFERLMGIPREMIEIVALKVLEIQRKDISLRKKEAEILGFLSSNTELNQYINLELQACNANILKTLGKFSPITIPASKLIPKHVTARVMVNPVTTTTFNIKQFRGEAVLTDQKLNNPALPPAGIRFNVVKPVYQQKGTTPNDRIEKFISLQGIHSPSLFSATSNPLFKENEARSWFMAGAGYGFNILRYNDAQDKVVFKICTEAGLNSAVLLGSSLGQGGANQDRYWQISTFRGVQPYINAGFHIRLGLPVWFTMSYQSSLLYKYTKSFSGDIPRFVSVQIGLAVNILSLKSY